jgi:hypothetical protein
MTTIAVNNESFTIILTEDQAAAAVDLLRKLKSFGIEALKAANAEYALALGRNQVEDLVDQQTGLILSESVVVITGSLATSLNTLLYRIANIADASTDAFLLELETNPASRSVLRGLWDEIHGYNR